MYTLDTNIIIALFQGDASVLRVMRKWQHGGTILITSPVTLTELLAFPKLTSMEETNLKNFLQTTQVVSFDREIAELAAYVKRTYNIGIADAMIAATAWQTRTILITRNVRDFRKVKEIAVETI